MTVAELIELLEKMNTDSDVYFKDSSGYDYSVDFVYQQNTQEVVLG